MLNSINVIKRSGVVFGTSGARGLVTQFSPDVCAAFTVAFVNVMKRTFEFDCLAIAIDNRPSSYEMAMSCAAACQQLGIRSIYYGVIPTPALAYQAMQDNVPCIMITGSHIPFDRNGIKFYRPDGEILKTDEQSIVSEQSLFQPLGKLPDLPVNKEAAHAYLERYTSLFTNTLLSGKKIGIYEHSSAGRDLYTKLFSDLGAEVVGLGRSDEFVPIDTEAVSDEDQQKAFSWSEYHGFDMIFSTDGDGDRPLISDEKGNWLRGDVLGTICAKALGLEALAVPISCNTLIESSKYFKSVTRTKIGSPYVIAEFADLAVKHLSVGGFEANGGFLLGTDVKVNNKILKALPTRDAVLPALMLFAESGGKSISSHVNSLPTRYTASDRIKNFPQDKSHTLLKKLEQSPDNINTFMGFEGVDVLNENTIDGIRLELSNDLIVHLRPSGNAPELRCYIEANTFKTAKEAVKRCLSAISNM
ncbi:phosphomannomutase [Thalassotalea montiporae]